mmetsp:Transcript_89981/g.155857  ORF Transcript_89981/g.155857 Transcript_89981/m.155857 type:complete len:415 (+) Transcript_89981:76-1320(+)
MNVFERFMCHNGDSDEEAPWINRRSPRARPVGKLQSKGGFAWEDPQSPFRPKQRKQSPQRLHEASGPPSRGNCRTPIRGDMRPPVAVVNQEVQKQGKNVPRQKSDEALPIWEDGESDAASSLAKECDGGAIVTKIPKQYRLSFSDENSPADANIYDKNPDRWEAMKIATQQAAMREEAARAVLHSKTPRSQSFLPAPPLVVRQETTRTVCTTIPHSQSYLPSPPPAPTFSTVCPQSPSHCLTFLPLPPPPQRERSPTPRASPRCHTMRPMESPRLRDVQSSSCLTPRRGSPSQLRTQSLNRAPSAVSASLSRAQPRSPGPPRRNGKAPRSAHGIASVQSPVVSRTTSSRGPSMSPTHSFFGGVSQRRARHGRTALSFQPPPKTDVPLSARGGSARGPSTPVKIGSHSQALSSPS